jgi:hypothetical protein
MEAFWEWSCVSDCALKVIVGGRMIAEEKDARQRVEEFWSPDLRVSSSRRDNPMYRLDAGL